MASNRSRGTLIDYLVAAIEPALIMTMVGSLMFFMLDTWYEGEVLDRLRWILFWFVFGIVLITRISMQIGNDQAKAYGIGLGGAVALVATSLAGFQPFLFVVMGVVWWATHNLTFDCTLLDEDQDSGVGLLQQSGLDAAADHVSLVAPEAAAAAADDPDAMDESLRPRRPWWKTWGSDAEAGRRPHAPGVWLIYFTIASLPLFALGQWLVPAVEEDRRAWLFVYFLAYIASAMGLLLATSFLNLRRYLRKRKVRMPAAMAATWLTTGAIVIVGLTMAAAVLPLPLSRMKVLRGSTPARSDLRASKYAVLKDSGVQGEGARSEGKAASKAAGKPQSSGKPQGSGQANDPNASQQVNGKGRQGGKSAPGRSKSGAPRGKPSPSKGGASGKQGKSQDQSGDQGKRQDQSENQGKSQDQSKGDDQGKGDDQSQQGEQKDSEQGEQKDADQGEREDAEEKSSDQSGSSSQAPPVPPLPLLSLSWLQTPIYAAGVAFLIYGLIRYGRDLLRAIMAVLAGLFGLWSGGPRKPKEAEAEPAAAEPPPRPFSAYVNPFDAGLDQQYTPNDLIVYSFEALEAWAYEHDLARSPHETPSEFVQRLAEARADLGRDATRLVGYFVMIVYGEQGFQAEVLPPLRQFWRALQG